MKLSEEELFQVTGGGIKIGIIAGILSAVVTIIGVIDGFLRPKKCN